MHLNNFLVVSFLSTFAASKPLHSFSKRAPVAIPGYDYIGCYTDSTSVRTFTGKTYIDDEMTIEKCAAACTGFTYFGTEYGRECFCGNVPDAGSVKVQEAFCSFSCPGDTTQTCGAGDHLTTYAVTGTVVVNPGTPPNYGSLGCHTEATSGRALTGALFVDDQLTVEKCAGKCAGFKYFALEYQRECFCGNDPLGSGSVKVSQLECHYNCGGDRTQSCGGDLRLNLWEFGAASVPEEGPETSYNREGCYKEAYTSLQGQGLRALTGKQYFDDAMTIEKCATSCAGFTYFGVEWARECYCGNAINTGSVAADDAICSFACAGNDAQKCGAGEHANSIQTTTSVVSSSTSPSSSTTTVSSTTSESSTITTTISSTTTTSSPSPTPTTTTTATTTTTTTTTTTSGLPALQTFALRGGNTSQNNARGQLLKVRLDVNGYILYIFTSQAGYQPGSFYLEPGTNRLKVAHLYVVQSSNLSLYSATAAQVGANNYFVACVGPAIQGRVLQCSSERTARTQFRTSGNTASTNLATTLYDPSTALGASVSFELIVESVA